MDFLKTLLLYMSLASATVIQDGPLPQDVPTPTPVPTVAVVETVSDLPSVTADATTRTPQGTVRPETPKPTATVTPPPAAPTLTPNPAYTNLSQGSRGTQVRKLQNRLIELGYLPQGSADGAFGAQTRRAVMAFQEANGLHKDGVAGDATQTHLYEDPDVVHAATPTPPPTQAPTPTPSPTIAPPRLPEGDANAQSLGLTQVANAMIVLSDSGKALLAKDSTQQVNGLTVAYFPAVYLNAQGEAVLALSEIASGIEGWTLSMNATDKTAELTAADYALSFSFRGQSPALIVDALPVAVSDTQLMAEVSGGLLKEIFISESFLRQVFHASTIWDSDEATLMLGIPTKDAAGARD